MTRWRHHDVEVQVEGEDGRQKTILRPEMNLHEAYVQYAPLDVYIRHDTAEIRGLEVVAPLQSQDFPILPPHFGI